MLDFLLGAPLRSSEDSKQRVGVLTGIPIFGLDAMASAAYGPEATLTVLRPLGALGLVYILPLTVSICVLLTIVFFSYRQTIAAYPGGGGSYIVAKENLGPRAGIVAASALMIDYLLNVAVAISAGIGAVVSAVPRLQPATLPLCLAVLLLLTLTNLRGVREPGAAFLGPTILYVCSLAGVLAWGVLETVRSAGHPQPAIAPPAFPHAEEAAGIWILLKAFANGCTALTGIEAVSNGVPAFQRPAVKSARATFSAVMGILIAMLLGIAFLSRAYRISATAPGQPGYQSVLSQITAAVAGHGAIYYIAMAGILAVLCLSANTSFADFPRVCRSVALDGYLPRSLASRGRRLVYSEGIFILAVLAALLLVVFDGVTDRLIPLFAIGAFLAFTLSQAGMVAHWKRKRGKGSRRSMWINGLGACATGATVLVVLAAKFTSGAWVVILLAPVFVGVMLATRRHYLRVARQTAPKNRLLTGSVQTPLVVVPVEKWSSISQKAIQFALSISADVEILHVESAEEDPLPPGWAQDLERTARKADSPAPRIVRLPSPYRFVVQPIIDHILALERRHKDREIAVVIPTLVEKRWYQYFLHNQRSELLSGLLLLEGDQRIVIVNVPWYLDRPSKS